MRALAIFIILFHHLPQYYFNYYDLKYLGLGVDLSVINDLNRYLGLGIFMFSSGYLLYKGENSFSSWNDLGQWLLRRYVRILPLYWLALLIFILGAGGINIFSFAAHVLGLQVIVKSVYCKPIFTLWYVGVIITYYYFFAIIVRFGNTRWKFLVLGTSIFVILFGVKSFFGITDGRLMIYFPVFFIGMLASREGWLEKLHVRHFLAITGILSALIFLYVEYLYPQFVISPVRYKILSFSYIIYLLIRILIMLMFSLFVFYCSGVIVKERGYKYLRLVAYSSFCMYLFHRPVWHVLHLVYKTDQYFIYGIYMIILGVSCILMLSYVLQKIYDIYFAKRIEEKLIRVIGICPRDIVTTR